MTAIETLRDETLPEMRTKANDYCTTYSEALGFDPVVEKEYGRGRRKYNATLKMTEILGDVHWAFGEMFGDKISVDDCDEADCLHPCYGASHERYCSQCWMFAKMKIDAKEPFFFTEDE